MYSVKSQGRYTKHRYFFIKGCIQMGVRKKAHQENAHQVNPISKKALQENCPSAKVMGRKVAHQFFKIGLFSGIH